MSSTGAIQWGSYFHAPSFQRPFLFVSHLVAPSGPWADGWHLGRDNTRPVLPGDPHGAWHCCRGQQQPQVVYFLKHLLTKNVSFPAMSKEQKYQKIPGSHEFHFCSKQKTARYSKCPHSFSITLRWIPLSAINTGSGCIAIKVRGKFPIDFNSATQGLYKTDRAPLYFLLNMKKRNLSTKVFDQKENKHILQAF